MTEFINELGTIAQQDANETVSEGVAEHLLSNGDNPAGTAMLEAITQEYDRLIGKKNNN